MPNALWDHQSAGAVIMGPDGRVYLVPAGDQAAVPIPAGIGPMSRPGARDAMAGVKARKGVGGALDHLPQMPNVMC